MIKEKDFIFLRNNFKNLVKNSVGLVKSIQSENAVVFFIGEFREEYVPLTLLSFLDINKTGKPKTGEPYPTKICGVCHVLKSYYGDFEINQTDAYGRKTTRPACRDCRKKIDGIAILPSEKKKASNTQPNKGDLFICPLCHKPSIAFVTDNIVIDHDHSTGKAREWICDSCNTGLGRFKVCIGSSSILKSTINA